jgi:Tol biopolymer transport system component
VSIASDGTQANSSSLINRISANGQYVVFETFASNLSPEDTDDQLGVYMHDMQAGETSHVSIGFIESIYDRYSLLPDISADGRYVSFLSDLRDGHEGDAQIYRRDRQVGTTEIVSTSADGYEGNKGSTWSSISDNGRWIAFTSKSDNLVNVGGIICDDCENIYLKDLDTGAIILITKNIVGDYSSNGRPFAIITFISGDGSCVVFDSMSNDLILDDSNGYRDIFVYGWKTTPIYSVNLPLVFR